MDKITLEEAQSAAKELAQNLERGCGDHSCAIKKPTGMGTNGGCRCNPKGMAEDFMALAVRLEEVGRYWKIAKK